MSALEDCRQRPGVVLVGGLPGTGKSTLAQALARQAGFELIRSDQIRKELAAQSSLVGVHRADLDPSEIYTREWTDKTYQSCLDRADAALFDGKRVLIDATFRQESQRQRFLDLAATWGVPAVLLLCQADPDTIKSRLDKRRDDVSDADWSIYLQAAERWEPLGAPTQRQAHLLDTSRELGSSLISASSSSASLSFGNDRSQNTATRIFLGHGTFGLARRTGPIADPAAILSSFAGSKPVAVTSNE